MSNGALTVDKLVAPRATGRYTLMIEGNLSATDAHTIAFTLHVSRDVVRTMPPGQTETGTIALPGECHVYSFNVTTAGRSVLSGVAPNYQHRTTIRNSDGTEIAKSAIMPSATVPLYVDLEPGRHTVMVDGSSFSTPPYEFTLVRAGAFEGTAANRTVSSAALGEVRSPSTSRAPAERVRFGVHLLYDGAARVEDRPRTETIGIPAGHALNVERDPSSDAPSSPLPQAAAK